MAKFFSHWSCTECGPWSYKVWMGPSPVWSFPGFYPWSATVYYLYIWALHVSGRDWSPRLALRGCMLYTHTSTADPQMLLWSFGKWVMYWETWRHGCHPIACV